MARTPSSPYRMALRAGLHWLWARLKALRVLVREQRQRLPLPVKRVIRRIGRITAGTVAWTVAAIAGLFVIAHFWLPTIAQKKADIEQYLGAAIGNPVELGGLETFWDGLNPGLRVQDLRILTAAGEPALRLREAQLSLSWRALLVGSVEINNLTLVGPQLTVERTAAGSLRITGLAPQTATPAALPDFTDWLFRQRAIAIVDGELQWADYTVAGGPERLAIGDVTASIYNDGARHAFALRARFPDELCSSCRVAGVITGNPLRDSDWEGEVQVQGEALDLQRLPQALRQRLPAGIAGRIDANLTGRWQEARLTEVRGQGRVRELSLPVGARGDVVALREAAAGLDWRGEPGRWRLRLDALRLARVGGEPWLAGQVEMDVRAAEGEITIQHLNLAELAGFLDGWSQAEAIRPWLGEAKPAGWLQQLQLSWTGSPFAPTSYRLEGRVDGLQAAAVGKVPGITGLSGRFSLTPEEGEFRVESFVGALDLPRVMVAVIPFGQLSARLHWQREEGSWVLHADDIAMRNADARVNGEVELRFPTDRQQSPYMKMRMSVRDGRGESAERYFPRVLSEKLRVYLQQAVQGGRVTRATVVAEGTLRDFPYRAGNGRFEVLAQVRNGQLEFLPGWAPLRNLDVDMRFTGTGMLLTAESGSLGGLRASRLVAEIEDFLAPAGAVLTVHGHTSGPAAEALTVLRDSNTPRFRAWLLPGIRVSGHGALDLDLRLPLKSLALALAGEYRVEGGQLTHDALPQPVERMRGMIGFDQGGLRHGAIEAQWLGGPLRLQAGPAVQAGVEVAVRGHIAAGALPALIGPALGKQAQGSVPWQLQWLTGTDRNWLTLEADLADVEIRLPLPLEKPRGEALKLEARSSGFDGQSLLLDLQAGDRLSGKLAWRMQDGQWALRRGRLAMGERVAPMPVQDGMHISARLPALNIDRWWPVLQPLWESSTRGPETGLVNRVSVDVAAFYFLDRTFGRLALDLAREAGAWSGRVDGEVAVGEARIKLPAAGDGAARPGLQLALERLRIPEAAPGGRVGTTDPRKLPALRVKSESFQYANYDLGRLEFRAEPSFGGWRIAVLRLERPETVLKASGQWLTNRLGKQTSRFDLDMVSSNFGETLGHFGYADELAGGKLDLRSNWEWPGAPGDFTLASLGGEVTFELKNGRLPRISPGAGRLFGAFDLRSVTRILTLNFSSLVGKGLSFDNLHGKLEVDGGNAYTRGLAILSPGADIELRGRIGLATRDLDMEMVVTPRVSTNLAPVIGGTILGGPVVGGAIAVISGVTRKPLEKSARTEYAVTGPWEDPKVVPRAVEAAGEPERP